MPKPRKGFSGGLWTAAALIVFLGANISPGDAETAAGPEASLLEPQVKVRGVDLAVTAITKVVLKQSQLDHTIPPTRFWTYKVRITIHNFGSTASKPFKVHLSRRPEPASAWGGAYKSAGVLNCQGLKPGASITLETPDTFVDEEGLDTRWWCFRAIADRLNETGDVNTKNNVLIQTDCKLKWRPGFKIDSKIPDGIIIKPDMILKPDLVITDMKKRVIDKTTDTYKITPVTKTRYKLVVWVKNEGPGPAGPSKVKIERYPEPKQIWKSGYEDVIVLDCPGLAAGATTTLVAEGPFEDIECVHDPRWWCYKATADSTNAVDETNETNNVYVQTNCKQY